MKILDVSTTISDYHDLALLISFPTCTFKCCTEQGLPIETCQNSGCSTQKAIDVTPEFILSYFDETIHEAIVFGGLEPFDSFEDMYSLCEEIRFSGITCPIIIYTGYEEDEVSDKVKFLKTHGNMYIVYGRFIVDRKKKYDELVGVTLASDNQHCVYYK